MNNQEITKKISHYIGEIIVVTIGIFIAFQLNNYSENKKTKNSEISSLKRLVSDLETEKRSITGHWKKREKQIQKVLLNTNYMYNSIKGIAGNAIQTIQALELPENQE